MARGSGVSLSGVGSLSILSEETSRQLYREVQYNERLHDHCGVAAVSGVSDAAHTLYRALHQLQHRGQESAGIVTWDDQLFVHKARGLVGDAFPRGFDFERKLPGTVGIGHVRYSTSGGDRVQNVQPLVHRSVCVSHNGNLINSGHLRARLTAAGVQFESSTDTEVINHLILQQPTDRPSWVRITQALEQVKGSYSLVILIDGVLFAVRDPSGNRPLVLGKTAQGVAVASETCALPVMNAEFLREVEPGEIVEIHGDKITSYDALKPFEKSAQCLFELIYFARPDSKVFGHNVYSAREMMGRILAKESPVKADVVVPVLDSGMVPGLGFSSESGIPLRPALVRNHYSHRTFIEPTQALRNFNTRMKHNVNADLIRDKSVVLVDDSIVRGTTMIKLIALLRDQGAKEVHVRISSPPVIGACEYGIDTPSQDELMAAKYTVPEMAKILGADSLAFLELSRLRKLLGLPERSYCDACFTGAYPLGRLDAPFEGRAITAVAPLAGKGEQISYDSGVRVSGLHS